MKAGFLRAMILYTANENAAPKIHQSPSVNRKCINTSQLPRLSNIRMPAMQMSSPSNRWNGICSFRKMRASMNENIGDEVVPMSAKLMAAEKCPATYTRVLNTATPASAAKASEGQCCSTTFLSRMKACHPKGSIMSEAHAQRENASVIGGIEVAALQAMMKLPLQMSVARMASNIPATV